MLASKCVDTVLLDCVLPTFGFKF